MICGRNFSGQATPDAVDEVYERCNFTQPSPIEVDGRKEGMRLFPGDDTPRTFICCNLVNCELPLGSQVTDCNTTVKEVAVVTSVEEVEVDGEVVGTIDHHSEIIHGCRTADGYDYLPEPIEIEVD